MPAPLSVTQKLATAKTWQNTGSNLSEFQAWLGTIPADASQYANQQVAVLGGDPGVIFIRQPNTPIIGLNATDWLICPDDSTTGWSKLSDQDYQKSWG
jgi:hypothetical protein